MSEVGLSLLLVVVIARAAAVLSTGRYQTRSGDVDGSSPTSRSCVYSFQVWTPNQDVLAKLRRLEERCDAVRSGVDREVRLKPNTHRRRRRDETVESRRVGGVNTPVGSRDPLAGSRPTAALCVRIAESVGSRREFM